METLKIGQRLAQRYHVQDKILWLDGTNPATTSVTPVCT
jgi:hypothetical protein